MKKSLLALTFAFFAFPAGAWAWSFEVSGYDWRPYVGVGVQGSIATVEVQVPQGWNLNRATAFGGIFDFAVGVKHERVRLELNYFGRASLNDPVSWTLIRVVSASAESGVLANIYYDWVSAGFFSMYVGAGAGLSRWSQSTSYVYLLAPHHYERDGTDLVWNILTGMSFTIADTVSLDFGMGYQRTLGIDFRGVNFKMGLRYTF